MNEEEFIEYLILQGAVEIAAIDSETGDFLYSFTDKLIDVDPDLYRKQLEYFQYTIRVLWQKGFLDMNIDDPNPTVKITTKALDAQLVAELPTEERSVLQTVMQAMSQ